MTANHAQTRPPDANRLLLLISDIEMGGGGVVDDFPHTAFLADLLRQAHLDLPDVAIDFIFNGDTFDFLKTNVDGKFPYHVNATIAQQKLERISEAHAAFFDALQEILAHQEAPRNAYFIVGNHDLELLFDPIQEAIQRRIGAPQHVHFPGLSLEIGEVHVEHGHQQDILFRIDPENPFTEYNGETILNLPWASVALLEGFLPLQPIFYHHERLKPHDRLFALLPELKELLLSLSWRYWTRDYWRGFWKNDDPVKKMNWTMFKEIAYRMRSRDTSITIQQKYRELLMQSPQHRLFVIGHEHRPSWWSYGNLKLLQTGCLRSEYMLEGDKDNLKQTPIPKVYAEAWMKDDTLLRSYLVEIDTPPPPASYVPDSIFFVLPQINALLGSSRERKANQLAWQSQEEKETKHEPPSTENPDETDTEDPLAISDPPPDTDP